MMCATPENQEGISVISEDADVFALPSMLSLSSSETWYSSG